MSVARETNAIVREQIPSDIWKKLGGQENPFPFFAFNFFSPVLVHHLFSS